MTVSRTARGLNLLATIALAWAAGGCAERASVSASSSPPERPDEALAATVDPVVSDPAAAAPAYDYRTHEVDYAGPGREDPAPQDIEEVRIGWFGPMDPEDLLGGSLYSGAALAIEEANADGGFEGRPFRLLGAWSENPWGSGVSDLARLVYVDGVWALLGGPDSASTHLAEQVVSKARLAQVSPVATEKSSHFVNVPWIYSLAPPDPEIAEKMADSVRRRVGSDRFLIISGTDHDSRQLSHEILHALSRSEARPALQLELRPGEPDLDDILERALEIPVRAAVIVAGAAESARILEALRRSGFEAPVVGGPQMGGRAFSRTTRDPGDLTYPVLWKPAPTGSPSPGFASRFRERFGREPDFAAAYGYDSAALVVAAIRKAGLNRILIRDALREIPPWEGVTGEIRWDATGRRAGSAFEMGGTASPGRRTEGGEG